MALKNPFLVYPQKKLIGNMDQVLLRLLLEFWMVFILIYQTLNIFINLKKLTFSENIIPNVAISRNKLPELFLAEILGWMKEAFPEYY